MKKLTIATPIGDLVAELSTDPDYPGIYVSLNDEVISVTECDIDNNIQTFAYVFGQEDWETKTIFKEGKNK